MRQLHASFDYDVAGTVTLPSRGEVLASSFDRFPDHNSAGADKAFEQLINIYLDFDNNEGHRSNYVRGYV